MGRRGQLKHFFYSISFVENWAVCRRETEKESNKLGSRETQRGA